MFSTEMTLYKRFFHVSSAFSTRLIGIMDVTSFSRPKPFEKHRASDMNREQQRYISYLIRLWQVKNSGGLIWRASLESSRTGKRQGFADLDALFAFLRQQTGVASDSQGDKGGIGEQR